MAGNTETYDIVLTNGRVIDPETVTDMETFKEPQQLSKGMKHVIVNGTFLIRDEELDTNAMPGQPVRGKIIS